jgi:hypothetical protein
MTNRGYAALNVNFRSSTGFGKAFTNAGDKAWGTGIMQDQIDAVQWAIKKGIADPARVAVMGGSFGGYSTLAGLTMFPNIRLRGGPGGPSNLITCCNHAWVLETHADVHHKWGFPHRRYRALRSTLPDLRGPICRPC